MKLNTVQKPVVDDIADLIDEAIAHPDKVGSVKEAIRRKLREDGDLKVVSSRSDTEEARTEGEDLWDNLPV